MDIQEKPDGMFYSVSGPALDGSWTSTPKNIDDITETIDGSSSYTINQDKASVTLICSTDKWCVINVYSGPPPKDFLRYPEFISHTFIIWVHNMPMLFNM